MIVKKVFNPLSIILYMQKDLLLSVLFTASVFVLYEALRFRQIILPFSIAAILGSALAIFIAFRNNNSYNRWWEARTLWGNILNNSRIFARQIISNADYAANIGKASAEAVITYKKEMIYRQIAFAHALRLHLRKQHTFEEFEHLLTKAEFEKIILTQNLPNGILLTQGIRIKEGMRDEILGAFDNISLEPTLGGFNNFQGACERIKNTPLLCQYHFFTNLFLQVFMLILPFCLIGDFAKLQLTWLMIPVAVLISFVFGVMAKVGEVNEDPFENKITDVPLTALCNTIERDLKEMLYETVLPPTMEAEKGYLF